MQQRYIIQIEWHSLLQCRMMALRSNIHETKIYKFKLIYVLIYRLYIDFSFPATQIQKQRSIMSVGFTP